MICRFKSDENLPREAVGVLRKAGHDVMTVLDEGLGGSSDSSLLAACRHEDRVLVTLDLDFADLQLYPPADHPGIWVLRGSSQTMGVTATLLERALALLAAESPKRRLWIIEHGRVRIRT